MSNVSHSHKTRKFLRPALVSLLWLGVMGIFFTKEILPSLTGPASSIPLLQAGLPELVGDEWMGIFYGREQVGYAHTVLYPYREEGFYGSALDSTVWLELPLLGRSNRVRVSTFCLIAPGGEIARLTVSASSAAPALSLQARLKDSDLVVLITAGGETRELSFPLPRPSLPAYVLTPFLALRPLGKGETFTVSTLDPLASLTAGRPEEGTVRFEVVDQTPDGFRLLAYYGGMTGELRLDPAGNVREITTPFGWTMKRQTAAEVTGFLERIK
ncbi:MAG: hypothetical protein V1789_10475 [PVC group bacterium]